MGAYNSSTTRVVPVFNRLMDMDPTGATWLDTLIGLGSRKEVVFTVPKEQRLIPGHAKRWGTNEASLPAPLALLEYLVKNLDPKRLAKSKDSGETLDKRTRLANRDPVVIREALTALHAGDRGSRWFVLEGASRPDALLESDSHVLCIEGKRTERECTTETTWMACRSQLVRHMDAAMEAFHGKTVLGLLIVEEDADRSGASEHWHRQSKAQYADEMLEASLPHRSHDERERIGQGMLGVTTWQAVCGRFGIAWPPSVDAN